MLGLKLNHVSKSESYDFVWKPIFSTDAFGLQQNKKNELFYCKCHDHFNRFEHILQHLRHQQYIQLC